MLRTEGFKEVIDDHNRSGKGKIEIVASLSCHGGNWEAFVLATELPKLTSPAHPTTGFC